MQRMNKNPINIQIQPDKINAVYTDAFSITRSLANFTLDLGQQVPQLNMVNIFSRVAFSPQHAKQLSGLINDAIKEYEKEFGEIKITPEMREDFLKQGMGFKP